MTNSYPYICKVTPQRKSRLHLVARSTQSAHRSTTCAREASTFRHGLTFIGSLLMAAATIEEAPLIALAALAMMVWAVNQINKEEKKCLRNL